MQSVGALTCARRWGGLRGCTRGGSVRRGGGAEEGDDVEPETEAAIDEARTRLGSRAPRRRHLRAPHKHHRGPRTPPHCTMYVYRFEVVTTIIAVSVSTFENDSLSCSTSHERDGIRVCRADGRTSDGASAAALLSGTGRRRRHTVGLPPHEDRCRRTTRNVISMSSSDGTFEQSTDIEIGIEGPREC
ncbi:hypothetical protein EVAR_27838_1 [Eumeta japonica]|uniref:Uncharacterized protein n=1 Tax=Eumeta variegata TaxID=151549 RepID=A0A4C1VJE3_EUMVA|nr:hypothetical protein EVAR_27838_1 [Eumeta japonica]